MKIKYFVFIGILLLASCSINKAPQDKIVFGVDTVTMASAPVFVAEAKGFWKQEGLDVEIKPFVSGRLALDALVGKSVDAATVADISVVLANFQQQKAHIIGTFSTSEKHVNMLAQKNKGISKPKDIKGKKIAISKGTSGEYVLSKFLEKYNISDSEVKITALNPPDMVPAIIRGDVDAILTWQPHIYNAQKNLGKNAVIFSSEGLYNHPFNVVVMDKGNKETQKKLLIGLKHSAEFMKSNRDESIQIVAKRIGIDAKDVEALWNGYLFDLSVPSSTSLENVGNWAKKTGIIKQDAKEPDYKSIIDEEFLNSIK